MSYYKDVIVLDYMDLQVVQDFFGKEVVKV